jgi:hypothetical protein
VEQIRKFGHGRWKQKRGASKWTHLFSVSVVYLGNNQVQIKYHPHLQPRHILQNKRRATLTPIDELGEPRRETTGLNQPADVIMPEVDDLAYRAILSRV